MNILLCKHGHRYLSVTELVKHCFKDQLGFTPLRATSKWRCWTRRRVSALRSPWPRGNFVRPLGELKYATVEIEHGTYRLAFVMEGGHRESLDSYSDREGQREAADAVNRFLGLEHLP